MCLITFIRDATIASKDIEVYKVVRKHNFLYYSPCMYTLLREYPKEKEVEIYNIYLNYYNICGGVIHCYTDYKYVKQYKNITPFKIVKGIIPKGTEYWLNTNQAEIAAKCVKFKVPLIQRIAMFIRNIIYK